MRIENILGGREDKERIVWRVREREKEVNEEEKRRKLKG